MSATAQRCSSGQKFADLRLLRCSSESSNNPFAFVKAKLLAAVVSANDSLLARNLLSLCPQMLEREQC